MNRNNKKTVTMFDNCFNWIKNLILRYKYYKDRKFIERIDRVYFKVDNSGNRFIKGHLHTIYDEKTKTNGLITAWADKKPEDID